MPGGGRQAKALGRLVVEDSSIDHAFGHAIGDLARRYLQRHGTERAQHFGMLFALKAHLETGKIGHSLDFALGGEECVGRLHANPEHMQTSIFILEIFWRQLGDPFRHDGAGAAFLRGHERQAGKFRERIAARRCPRKTNGHVGLAIAGQIKLALDRTKLRGGIDFQLEATGGTCFDLFAPRFQNHLHRMVGRQVMRDFQFNGFLRPRSCACGDSQCCENQMPLGHSHVSLPMLFLAQA